MVRHSKRSAEPDIQTPGRQSAASRMRPSRLSSAGRRRRPALRRPVLRPAVGRRCGLCVGTTHPGGVVVLVCCARACCQPVSGPMHMAISSAPAVRPETPNICSQAKLEKASRSPYGSNTTFRLPGRGRAAIHRSSTGRTTLRMSASGGVAPYPSGTDRSANLTQHWPTSRVANCSCATAGDRLSSETSFNPPPRPTPPRSLSPAWRLPHAPSPHRPGACKAAPTDSGGRRRPWPPRRAPCR